MIIKYNRLNLHKKIGIGVGQLSKRKNQSKIKIKILNNYKIKYLSNKRKFKN